MSAVRGIVTGVSTSIVFAPCAAVAADDQQVQLLLLQSLPDVLLLPAWSSLDRLIAACGEHQPWVSVELERIDAVRADAGAVAVLLDPLPPEVAP